MKKVIAIVVIFCAVFSLTFADFQNIYVDTVGNVSSIVNKVTDVFLPNNFTPENSVYLVNGSLGYNRYDTDIAWKIRRDIGLTEEHKIYPNLYNISYKTGSIFNREEITIVYLFKVITPNGTIEYYSTSEPSIELMGDFYTFVRIPQKWGLKFFYKNLTPDPLNDKLYFGVFYEEETDYTVLQYANDNWE